MSNIIPFDRKKNAVRVTNDGGDHGFGSLVLLQRWVWAQKTIRTTDKLVLLNLACHALASRPAKEGVSYSSCPSIQRIASDTALDRKTVVASIARLCEAGFIEPSGKKGRSRVNVYRIKVIG